MINNFPVIDKFLQFEDGTFYKFELLVRNTDGNNVLYPEGCSNVNKNILIKSWYVDCEFYYEKIKHQMITLANLTGGRLYMTLDRKGILKFVQNMLHDFTDALCDMSSGYLLSIKSISKIFASESSKVESSCKDTKTIMFDIDTKDERILEIVKEYIQSKGQQPYVLNTKKGYHVFCYKKFNCHVCLSQILDLAVDRNPALESEIKTAVSVKENELGLVYHPMKNNIDFHEQLLEIISPYLGDFTGYDEESRSFDTLKAVAELLETAYDRRPKFTYKGGDNEVF